MRGKVVGGHFLVDEPANWSGNTTLNELLNHGPWSSTTTTTTHSFKPYSENSAKGGVSPPATTHLLVRPHNILGETGDDDLRMKGWQVHLT